MDRISTCCVCLSLILHLADWQQQMVSVAPLRPSADWTDMVGVELPQRHVATTGLLATGHHLTAQNLSVSGPGPHHPLSAGNQSVASVAAPSQQHPSCNWPSPPVPPLLHAVAVSATGQHQPPQAHAQAQAQILGQAQAHAEAQVQAQVCVLYTGRVHDVCGVLCSVHTAACVYACVWCCDKNSAVHSIVFKCYPLCAALHTHMRVHTHTHTHAHISAWSVSV